MIIHKAMDYLGKRQEPNENGKAFINGTYHGLGRKLLDFFLVEFCYHFNQSSA